MQLQRILNRSGLILFLSILALCSTSFQIINLFNVFYKPIKSYLDESITWHEVRDSICYEDITRIRSRSNFNVEYTNGSSYAGPTIPGWPPERSRNIEDYISPEMDSTLVFPKTLDLQNTKFLIVIHSRMKSLETRNVIRSTWGKVLKSISHNSSFIFVLGKEKSVKRDLKSLFEEEIQSHGDIFQDDFIDSYNNLTLKSISTLKFLARTVQWRNSPRRILKVDDDVFLNIPLLLKTVFAPQVWCAEPYLAGVVLGNFTPHSVLPKTKSIGKWDVPSYMLEKKVYPLFLSGSAYMFSFSTAGCLLQESFKLPYFHLEDIFITSFAATRCNIRIQSLKGIVHWRTKQSRIVLAKNFAIHYSNKQEMKDLHSKVIKYYKLNLS